ncbi:MAG: cytochrome d ubiquinol oxidase subunit II [Chloroflexota bacterium]|nr:cytochrome d ubiquinol oxidase subunit II [Chloroflexota bacterium]
MIDLPVVWFALIAVLLTGYAVLDGFDLGAGILHFVVSRGARERGLILGSIAPVWDGNEVWLLTAGGALFAAFPLLYATVFSGFYLALVLVLLALIFRAVSLEVRETSASPAWRRGWDVVFSVSSFLVALLLGVAIGNVLAGIPLDAGGVYRGGLLGLLRPFPLLAGLLAVAMFTMQGAAWLALRTDGELRGRSRAAGAAAATAFVALWIVVTVASMSVPALRDLPLGGAAYVAPALVVGASAAFLAASRRGADGAAFLASSLAIAGLLALGALALFPDVLPATDAARSLTVRNAASSDLTLTAMLVIALVGMPLVLAYTIFVYVRFRRARIESYS